MPPTRRFAPVVVLVVAMRAAPAAANGLTVGAPALPGPEHYL
jgi:hypothetical protein